MHSTRSYDGYRLTGTRTQVGYAPMADASWFTPQHYYGRIFSDDNDRRGSVTKLQTTGLGRVEHVELDGTV